MEMEYGVWGLRYEVWGMGCGVRYVKLCSVHQSPIN